MDKKIYTKEDLIKQHDLVKSHFWRDGFEKKYLNDYYTELDKLSNIFYRYIKNTWPDKAFAAGNFCHDFNQCMFSFGHGYDSEFDNNGHIERCIMIIHKVILTDTFDEYYTYYTGCNICKSVDRLRRYIFKDGKWRGIYTEKELEDVIKEIEDVHKKEERVPEFGIYSLRNLEYYKEKLKEFNEWKNQ